MKIFPSCKVMFYLSIILYCLVCIQAQTKNSPSFTIGTINHPGNQNYDTLIKSVRSSQTVYPGILSNNNINADIINHQDNSWQYTKMLCEHIKQKIIAFTASSSNIDSYTVYSSVLRRLNIPFVNWGFNCRMQHFDTDADQSKEDESLELNMEIPVYKAVAWLIQQKNWTDIVMVCGDITCLEKLQLITDLLDAEQHPLISDTQIIDFEEVNEHRYFKKIYKSRAVLNRPQNYVVDVSTRNDQFDVLKALISESSRAKGAHYVLTNLYFPRYKLQQFKDGNANITGFNLLPIRKGQKIFPASEEHYNILDSSEQRFVHDSIGVISMGLKNWFDENQLLGNQLKTNNSSGKLGDKDTCNEAQSGLKPEVAKGIYQKMKAVSFEGASGHVQFDKQGYRTNFSLNILQVIIMETDSFTNRYHTDTNFTWSDNPEKIVGNLTSSSRQNQDFAKKIFKVVTVLNEPFVYQIGGGGCKGNDCFEGYVVDLLDLLRENFADTKGGTRDSFDFTYELHLVMDNEYGAEVQGKWDGMVGELLENKADLCVADLTITRDRERAVDFSKPFMTLGVSIMIKKPDKQEFSVFSFMSPLSVEIWMYIILAYLGVSLVIFVVARFSPYEWRIEETPNGSLTINNDFSVYNSMWFTLAAFMQQGTDILPRSTSGRIASSAWWFFTMILVSSYTANLAAFLTLEKMHQPISSAADLAAQTDVLYGIKRTGSTADFFKYSSVETYQRMWEFMSAAKPSVFVESYDKGIERVRNSKGRYAFLLESTVNDYINSRKPCDTKKVGDDNLNSVGYGIATPFNSDMRDRLNLAVLELQEKGELKNLHNKWWYDRGECDQGRSDSHKSALNLSKVAGIFYILIGGMVLAMFTSMVEFIYRTQIEARKRESVSTSDQSLNRDVDDKFLKDGLTYPSSSMALLLDKSTSEEKVMQKDQPFGNFSFNTAV